MALNFYCRPLKDTFLSSARETLEFGLREKAGEEMPKSTVKCQVCVKVSSLISFLGCGCHPFGGECPYGGRGRTNSRILMEMRRVWKAMRKPMSIAMRWGLRSGCLAAIRKKGKKQRAARSDSRPPIKPIDRLFHSAPSWSLLAIG